MSKTNNRFFSLYVTGFAQDIDRATLRNEFMNYGKVEKLYLENSGKFANVFFSDKRSCELAIQELNNTALGWQVEFAKNNSLNPSRVTDSHLNNSTTSLSSETSNMAGYRNNYDDDEDFIEVFDYCNVHGTPLTILQADTGDLYVNLKDIRRTGFALFRRDTFDSVLVDKRQIGKEFELHLLSEAKNYILKNRVAVIQEEDILKTIERCKNKLLGAGSSDESRSNFGPGRSVAPSRNNLTITSNANAPSQRQHPPANFPTTPQVQYSRPPKTLPNNFMPSNVRPNDTSRSKSQDRGGRGNQNNFRANDSRHNDSRQNDSRQGSNFNNNSVNNNRQRQFVSGFTTPSKREPVEHSEVRFAEPEVSEVRKPKAMVEHSRVEKKVPVQEEIGRLVLDSGSIYEVQVVYMEDKENVCWVQKKEDASTMDDVLLQINETEDDIETIEPTVGQLVIALFDGAWSRGRVIGLNPLMVHFIDYGNKSEVEAVKPLADAFKKIPPLAARVKINSNQALTSEMVDLTIRIKQQYDDGTYLAYLRKDGSSGSECDTTVTSKPVEKIAKPEVKEPQVREKCYSNIPKPMATLKDGDKVMVFDVENGRFIVRTKDCAQKCKEITEYIKNLDKSALTLQNVKVGQLVLCSKDGLIGLYRAVVAKKDNASVVTVKYIDFPGEDDLSIKSIRNVDAFLAQEPSSIILTPPHKSLQDVNDTVAECIQNICENKEKFTVVLSGDNFDLRSEDGTLLSEKVNELTAPKKTVTVKSQTVEEPEPAAPAANESSDTITYDDMEWISVKAGTHSFLCYHFSSLDDITMIDSREEVIGYFEEITGLEVTDNQPYQPEELEMCLVSYKGPGEEDASWCRATVLSVEEDGCDVSFVDFGNKEKVLVENIRKFPPSLKNIPMLGINCELVGVPHTPEILDRLKTLLPEGDQVAVVVKELSSTGHKYKIEIPSIYKVLKKEGLY